MKIFVLNYLLFFSLLTAQSQKPHVKYFDNPLLDKKVVEEKGYLINNVKTGYWQYYYTTGKVREQGRYKNGMRTGVWIINKMNSDLRMEISYVNDIKHGVWKKYFNDKISKANYYNDKLEGDFVSYNTNGNISITGKYHQGKKHGNWIYYFKDGSIKRSENWRNGKIYGTIKEYGKEDGIHYLFSITEYSDNNNIGKYQEFNSEGMLNVKGYFNEKKEKTGQWEYYYYFVNEDHPQNKLEKERKYRNDKCVQTKYYLYYDDWSLKGYKVYQGTSYQVATGLWESYFQNGNRWIFETWNSGKRIGLYFEHYENGNPKTRGMYDENGKKTGSWNFYHENGQLQAVGIMNEGKRIGEWEFYFSDGTLKASSQFDKVGERSGFWEFYFASGKIKSAGNYINGQREGEWKEFHENGAVKTTKKYKYGEIKGKVKAYDKEGNKIKFIPDNN